MKRLLDDLEERRERLRALVGLASFGIARMQMHDGGPRLGGTDGGVRDLLRRNGQRLRHRGGVDRTGHGAGDDDFPAHALLSFLSVDAVMLISFRFVWPCARA